MIWAVFAFEFAAVLIVASRRTAALRAHWLDAAFVVLTVPLVTEALAWLRLARFVRLARLGRSRLELCRPSAASRRETRCGSLRS